MNELENGFSAAPRRLLWTVTALAGVFAVGVIIWLAQISPASLCGTDASNAAPLTAFQSAKTADDIWAVFGAHPSDCRAALLTSMDTINRADLFAYIPAAALLLAGFLLASRRSARMWAFWIGAGAIFLTVAGDIAETSAQLAITSAIAESSANAAGLSDSLIEALGIGNTLKIYGLPVVFAALAAIWWGRGAWANLLSCILILCSASRFAGSLLPDIPSLPLIGGLFGVATLAVAAATMAMRRWFTSATPN